MMNDWNTGTVMPIQPYIVLMSQGYQRIEIAELGISHVYEFRVKDDNSHRFHAVPDGSIDLLFNIGDDGTVHTYLSGTVFKVKGWEVGDNNTCFGVRFQPGKGILPKDLCMDMIVNQDLEIDGRLYGATLPEEIAEAGDICARTRIFMAAYRKLVETAQQQDMRQNINLYVRDRISAFQGNIAIEKLAEETGYSACYIRRIFKQCNGISPKQFAEYVRFQHLLHIMKEIEGDYANAAAVCGYYDEPHMMKAFKDYTGVTPQQYSNMIENNRKFL